MKMLQPASVAARLRSLTPARVGLGCTGISQHTWDHLAFQRAHAQARDAVHARLDASSLTAEIARVSGQKVLLLHSSAPDRSTYLQRPDLGRTLDDASRAKLAELQHGECELALIVADGLSALAVERHAPALLHALLPAFNAWNIAPVCVVEQGRVAIGDEIGAALQAKLAVMLIGERPGLSSPDSLGAYITWRPRPGRTDAERNCISNIRTEGLGIAEAAAQIAACLQRALKLQLTGVALKKQTPEIETS